MKKQRGIVAILLLIAIAITAVAAVTSNLWIGETKAYQQKITNDALQQAKAALLTYVEMGATGNGANTTNNLVPLTWVASMTPRLPCPDQNGDGAAYSGSSALEWPCRTYANAISANPNTGYHVLGLLPWSTLNIPVQHDAYHQCLWYAVDGLFKVSTASTPVNSDSYGSFSVIQPVKSINSSGAVIWSENVLVGSTGSTSANNAVAVIISAGPAGGGQLQTAYGSAAAQTCPLTNQGLGNTATGAGAPSAEQSAPNYLKNYKGSTTSFIANNQRVDLNQSSTTQLSANTGSTTNTTALKVFITNDVNQEQSNDQVVWITPEEFSKAATKGVARIYAAAIQAYVTANGQYPPAALYAGGPCQSGQVQGFMPYTCTIGSTALNLGALASDADQWSGMAHYAVAPNCLNNSSNTACASPSNLITISGSTGVKALILMRGRGLSGEVCAINQVSSPSYVPDISQCIEGTTNKATVSAVTARLTSTSNKTISSILVGTGTIPYALPQVGVSNDFMVRLNY